MSEPDFLDCIDRGIALYWRTLGKMRGMRTHAGDFESTMPGRIFNVRLDPESVERRLDEIIPEMKAGRLPRTILIGPRSTPSDLAERLAGRGFAIDDSDPCMAMDLAGFGTRTGTGAGTGFGTGADAAGPEPPAQAIRVVQVRADEALRSWAAIVTAALFEEEFLTFEQFQDLHRLAGTRQFLAHWDGTPAATAMTIAEDGASGRVATLEFVSTLKDYRHRGLGTAVTEAALRGLKADGVKTVSLRSEAPAVGMYRRVGFREYCRRIVATLA